MQKRIVYALFILLGMSAQAQNICQANFQWNQVTGTNTGVQFTDSSSFSPTGVNSVTYAWSFGDGSSGTGPVVTHNYNSNGPFNVCLTITLFNPNGVQTCTNTSCQTILLNNSGNPCNGFAATIVTSGGSTLQAVTTGGTPPFSYQWTNNSSTTSAITPTTPGTYCVVVTDANGCAFTACQGFSGGGGCSFGVNIVPSLVGGLTAVLDSSAPQSPPYQYAWSNGSTGSTLQTTNLPSGVYCVTVTNSQNCTGTACYTYSPGSGCLDTVCGYAFHDVDGNGVMDSLDSPLSGVYITYFGGGQQGTAVSNSSGYYFFTYPCNAQIQVQSYGPNTLPIITVPQGGTSQNSGSPSSGSSYLILPGNSGCGYNFGFSNNFITVNGYVYADLNGNGLKDAGESGIPYQQVAISGASGASYQTYSNASGLYQIQLPVDTYQMSCVPGSYYSGLSVLPAQHVVNGSSAGQVFPNKNFGIQIPAGSVNLAVNLTPHTTVTPGFPAWYSLQVCNVGFTPTGGTADMFFDPSLVFDYASPAPTSFNNTTHTISWNIPVLAPGQCQNIWVDFNALVTAQLGTSTFELASVMPTGGNDIVMSNNVDTVHQIVVGSWDPNNKLSIQTNYENPAYQYTSDIDPNRTIEYTINFQNTGTAPAVNVVVLDELSADLDAETFEMITTSHPCLVEREGSSVAFKFFNIQLADSFSNEPESHGFISFRIQSLPGLAAGHVIADDADIYFDFNSPVNTGFSTVTQLDPTSVAEGQAAPALLVGPQPMNSFTRVQLLQGENQGFIFRITDMNGKVVRTMRTETDQLVIERGHLSAGLYTYEVETTAKQTLRGKLIVH